VRKKFRSTIAGAALTLLAALVLSAVVACAGPAAPPPTAESSAPTAKATERRERRPTETVASQQSQPTETLAAEATATPESTPTNAPSPSQLLAPPIPQNGAYLGAWVNPSKDSGGGTGFVSRLPQFKTDLGGRLPGILIFYIGFVDPFPLDTLQGIEAMGSVPLISWECKDVSQIAAGQYDQQITAYANGLKAFGHPVFVRWCWEMNLTGKENTYIGSAGPSGYIAAWKHIYTLFRQAGAANVAFVWCPGGPEKLQGMDQFFPGADYVDWIGIDGYLRQGNNASSFAELFMSWYGAYAKYNKPLIVVETGAPPSDQVAYLASIGQSVPKQFPALKGIVYFDAAGNNGEWELTQPGLAAFAQLLANPYFSFHQ
jgi:glycosyl hydrolase family 26